MATVLAAFTAAGALPGPEWWFPAPADAAWTNKSLRDIQVEADRNDPAGQYYLGYAYFFGQGCDRDASKAFVWIHRAAEQGYAQAQLLTARFYFMGLGTNRDWPEAVRWASRAAEQGHPDANALLGMAHASGEGTPRNAAKALECLQFAANAGSRLGMRWLADFYLKGEAGTAQRTNYVEALRWYERAGSMGMASAGMQAAQMYEHGLGTPPDFQRALALARLFAEKANPDAMEKLAGWYAQGLAETGGSDDSAVLLMRHSAVLRAQKLYEQNSDPYWALMYTCQWLWNHYRFGVGTPRDYVAAAEWMWIAHEADLQRIRDGRRSFTGQDVAAHPFDPILKAEQPALKNDERLWVKAVRLVHDALDERRPEACHRIGESYRDGSSLSPKQPLFAWGWFNRAAEMGHLPSRAALRSLESTFTIQELAKAKYFWVPPLATPP